MKTTTFKPHFIVQQCEYVTLSKNFYIMELSSL